MHGGKADRAEEAEIVEEINTGREIRNTGETEPVVSSMSG